MRNPNFQPKAEHVAAEPTEQSNGAITTEGEEEKKKKKKKKKKKTASTKSSAISNDVGVDDSDSDAPLKPVTAAPVEQPKKSKSTKAGSKPNVSTTGAANESGTGKKKKKGSGGGFVDSWTPPPPPPENEWGTVQDKQKSKPKKTPVADVAAENATESSITVAIEARTVGALIGPKGSTLYAVQDATGAKIDIPRHDPEGPKRDSVNVKITGPPDGVAAARRAIQELSKYGMCSITHSNFVENFVLVHPDLFHLIIGESGKTIRALQDATSTKIIMPSDPNPFKKAQHIKLVGQKANCDRVKAQIKNLTRFYHCEIAHPGLIHLEVDVDPTMYNRLIGTKGQTIRSIQGNTRAKIYIPGKDSVNDKVVIVGTPPQVAAASSQVEKALARATEVQIGRFEGGTDAYDDGPIYQPGPDGSDEETEETRMYARPKNITYAGGGNWGGNDDASGW